MKTPKRRLMWHGMLLFLLGLITGLLERRFTNVRMGLSAHLEGVLNRILLLALGAVWNEVRLPHPVKVAAYYTALCGTYANWLVTSIAAAFGTAANSPITSAGHSGQPWQESLVAIGHNRISHSDDCNYRYVDTGSLGSSRNGRRGQR
jgi:(hydroxyamino)benzene mutase